MKAVDIAREHDTSHAAPARHEHEPELATRRIEPARTVQLRAALNRAVGGPGFIGAVNAGIHDLAAMGVASGGGPLPHLAAIQRSFGHHDVTGVSAHIGGAAARASGAIGAHAYAVGNSVAFGASPDLHLAAHEAAHVVQQRGGVRLSGGVGRAGDVYEQHADAVADLVVRGASAESLLDHYAHRGSAGGPAIQRNATAHELEQVADVGETESRAEMADDDARAGGPSDPVAAMSVVGDIHAADAEVARIQAARPNLVQALSGRFSGFSVDALANNETAIARIRNYAFDADGQSQSIAGFQAQYQRLCTDFARIQAQATHFRASDSTGSTTGAQTGDALGSGVVRSTGMRPGSEPRHGDGHGGARYHANEADHDMTELAGRVPSLWQQVLAARAETRVAIQDMASGIEPRRDTEEQTHETELRTHLENISRVIAGVVQFAQMTAGSYVGNLISPATESSQTITIQHSSGSPGTVPSRVPGRVVARGRRGASSASGAHLVDGSPASSTTVSVPSSSRGSSSGRGPLGALTSSGGPLRDITSTIVNIAYEEELRTAAALAHESVAAETQAQIEGKRQRILSTDQTLRQLLLEYLHTVEAFHTAQTTYRDSVRDLAADEDPSGRREGVVGEFAAESGAFLAQAQITHDLGTNLDHQGDQVAGERAELYGHGEGAGPVQWTEAVWTPFVSRDGGRYEPLVHTVNVANMGHDTADDDPAARDPRHRGARATVRTAVADIERMEGEVRGIHTETGTSLGLSSARTDHTGDE
jgi:hypothetical protein